MEENTVAFLKRVGWTIFLMFTWMAINSTVGIMLGYGFVESSITAWNIVFYIWLLGSGTFLFIHFKKIWSQTFTDFNA